MSTSTTIPANCDYGKALSLINEGNAKNIFNCISGDIFTYTSYKASTHGGDFEDENSIAEIILQVVRVASESFCKEIAEKLFERKAKQDADSFSKKWNISLTDKQAWCVAFDIQKNKDTYAKIALAYCEEQFNKYAGDVPAETDEN